ncbi:MAG: zf-HC2 domain-containing protein [Nitrospirae bacterium]|nr:zf-HC2 domain-containing protein [Nitrospirota bacterium]
MKQCHTVRRLISAYIDGSVDDASRQQVEGHLSQCSDCARQLQQMRDLSHRLSAMPQVKAPADFLDGLRQRMEQPQRHDMPLKMPLKMPLGLAALAMLVLIALSVLHREPQMQRIIEDVKQPPRSGSRPESKQESKANGVKEILHDTLAKTRPQPPATAKKKAAKEHSADMVANAPASKPRPPSVSISGALPEAAHKVPAPPAAVPAPVPPTTTITAPAAPAASAQLEIPAPAARSKGQGVAAGMFNATSEPADEVRRPQQRITLTVSVDGEKARESGDLKDSGSLKQERSTLRQVPQKTEKKAAAQPDVFDQVATLISERGGKVVSDKDTRQHQYMEAEIPTEGYAALLSELRRLGSVEELTTSARQDMPPQKDRQQQPNTMLLYIKFQ